MTVTIRVTDSDGNTFEKDVDIDINDINKAPYNLDLYNSRPTRLPAFR